MTTRTHHACFSGDPTCSGADPCPRCKFHHAQCVLPVAIRAAGFDGAILADLHVLLDSVRAASDRMRMHAERFDRLGLRTEADQLRADAAALSIDRLPLSPEGMIRSEEDQIKLFLEGYEAGWQRLHDAMQNVENVRAEVVRTKVRAAIEDPIGDAPSPPAPAPPPPPTPIAAIAREIETQAPAALTAEDVAAAILPADVTHANGRADGSVVS